MYKDEANIARVNSDGSWQLNIDKFNEFIRAWAKNHAGEAWGPCLVLWRPAPSGEQSWAKDLYIIPTQLAGWDRLLKEHSNGK